MAQTPKAIATRRRIVVSAAELIARQGFNRTRLEEILQASHVQKGNFYYYFHSKDELGLAVLRECLQAAAEQWLVKLLDGGGDPWEELQQLPLRLAEAVGGADGTLSAVNQLAQDLAQAGSDYRSKAGRVLRELSGVLAQRFRQLQSAGRLKPGADPQALGEYLATVIDGALFWHSLTGDTGQLERTLQLAMGSVESLTQG
jgi:TetR/AcrR family transcriptional repressor of nem operon